MVRVLGVIPARFHSTRFPGKPLASLAGSTLIEHVWRRARAARCLERLVVATDDERIVSAVAAFGGEALLTSPAHPSGTDRVAEVARLLGDGHEIVLNIQGDEPLVSPTSLDALAAAVAGRGSAMATLAEPVASVEELFAPDVVKVVVAQDGRALYFSRSPIPYARALGTASAADLREALGRDPQELRRFRKHCGVYAYSASTLGVLTRLPPSRLEREECLEQLRALEAGIPIFVLESDFRSHGVDTPRDLARVARMIEPMEAKR